MARHNYSLGSRRTRGANLGRSRMVSHYPNPPKTSLVTPLIAIGIALPLIGAVAGMLGRRKSEPKV